MQRRPRSANLQPPATRNLDDKLQALDDDLARILDSVKANKAEVEVTVVRHTSPATGTSTTTESLYVSPDQLMPTPSALMHSKLHSRLADESKRISDKQDDHLNRVRQRIVAEYSQQLNEMHERVSSHQRTVVSQMKLREKANFDAQLKEQQERLESQAKQEVIHRIDSI